MAKKNRSLFSRKHSGKSKYRARKRRNAAQQNLGFESLETRKLLAVTTFQDGVGGYAGTEDTVLYSISPDSNFGSETSISPDQQDANGVRQGLLRFNDIIGNGTNQVPQGSTINSATLSVNVVNSSVAQFQMALYRMTADWSESISTWNSFGDIGGVQSSEGEATELPPDGILFDPNTGRMTFDITRSLKNWAAGQENLGWLIESTATDGWDWETSEAAVSDRPILTVDFDAPSGAGDIEFIETELRQAEGNSGVSTAQVTASRLGGVSGEVSATYTIAAGTADAGDFVADTGTVTFAAGETRKTIDVQINGDTELEGNETLTVTLSNATGGASIGSNDTATVTIADDDALINEVLANISPQSSGNILTDETDREYIELIGTPGASLDGYYFVVFEGQEEETAGTTDETGSGVADIVVDLSGQTFGSNGLLVLTPTNWAYTPAVGTNSLIVTDLDGAAGGIEDDSQTYALIRSSVAITQGTDYDTFGDYGADPTREAVDIPLGSVGVLDVFPFTDGTAQIVDSVSVFNGGSDRDRAAVTPDIGLPGVHVHQPTGASNSGNVASDAVSRREGNLIPNTIGAWFNGDILDTDVVDTLGNNLDVIEYLNGTTRISVVAPDGSVLTPGAPNTLNNIFVSVGVPSVDEAGGPTVTFTITREGDTTLAADVDFTTVDGTAIAGADYIAQSGTLSFADGETTKEVVVQVIDDGIAEGFETFGLALSNADSPFLITDGTASVTINDADVLVATFQNGESGYFGTVDTTIDGEQPFDNFGFSTRIIVDDAAGNPDFGGAEGADIRPQQGLLRFDNLFGNGGSQVPEGAQIFGGFLTLNVVNSSSSTAEVEVYRLLQDWDDANSNWLDPQGAQGGSVDNGFTPDNVEAAAEADGTVPFPGIGGKVQVPVSQETLQGWANGTLDNFGWAFISDSDSSWEFSSAQQFPVDGINLRPELTILYTDPGASSAGEFEFTLAEDTISEGGTATVTVQRVGGAAGTATVDYSVGFGTADASDISSATSGTLSFGDGVTSQTFQVVTTEDSNLELDETINLSLTGDLLPGGRSTSVLKIRNDDVSVTSPPVLVNEIVYNQPGNDGGAELFELAGTPNAPLGGLYAVVIAGDVGPDQGATDLVVDLGSFTNGANGITLIGARDTFTWDVPADTTFIGLEELNVEFLGGADNGTSTYALVYSPLEPLHTGRFDYDWDNDGSLELPLGATIVDSIAIQDNSTEDSTYGPGSNSLQTNPTSSFDAVSRFPGNTSRNTASAWYGADLFGSNDALVYDAAQSTGNIPSTGAAVTPGLTNTGNSAANPIVTVTSVDTAGGVVINFDGDVEQVLIGDGTSFAGPGVGPGISVTNTDGTEIAGVDAALRRDNITGLGTGSLAISFTGSATVSGNLPAGTYNLNFIGDSVVANGRALDAQGTGSPSNTSIEITVTAVAGPDADFDNDGNTDGSDFLAWQRGFGTGTTNTEGDADGDGDVDAADLSDWQSEYGGAPALAVVQQPAFESTEASVVPSRAWASAPRSGYQPSEVAAEEAIAVLLDSAFDSAELAAVGAAVSNDEVFVSAEGDDEEVALDDAFAELALV